MAESRDVMVGLLGAAEVEVVGGADVVDGVVGLEEEGWVVEVEEEEGGNISRVFA